MSERKTVTARRPDGAALCIAAILLVISAIMFWDMTRLSDAAGYSQVGPATVPKAIAFALIGLAVWTIIAAFRNDFPEREPQEVKPVLWIVGGLTAQMLLLNIAGFSIATGIMFALTAYGFGKRKLWFSVPVGIAACYVIWLIFAKLLQLSLPAGPLERLFF